MLYELKHDTELESITLINGPSVAILCTKLIFHSCVSLKFCSVFVPASMRIESGNSPGGGASIIVQVGAINAVWSFSESELSSMSICVPLLRLSGWLLIRFHNLDFKMSSKMM